MFKKLLYVFALAIFAIACNNATSTPTAKEGDKSFHGEKITADGALEIDAVLAKLGDKEKIETKMIGTVESVCQKKGCWMIVDGSPNGNVRVTFKDYGFFVPTNISGHRVIVEGVIDEANEGEESKHHYEKEEGMTAEQAEEVIEAGRNLAIVASGVIIEYPDGSDTDSSPDESSL